METSAPWLPEEKWKAGDVGSFYGDGAHNNNDYYCVDFNLGSGDHDKGSPILAVANGKVTTAHLWNGDKTTDPLGNYVRINHSTYESQYAHLDKLIVVVGQPIWKGQVIGYNGSKGNSTSPHLHFCLYQNGKSVEPNPMDGQTMADGALITSKNTNLFDETYNRFGKSRIGDKEGPLHWYYGWNNTTLYDSIRNKVANNIYIQDFQGGEWWDGAIVYDALGGARKAYLIHSGFWNTWANMGGPTSMFGAPINEEYEYPPGSNPKNVRQDFQRGFLLYQQGANPEISVIPLGSTMPGMYIDGWYPETSYAFAEAYERNGARNMVGEPFDNGGGVYVHSWNNLWIQDFRYGKYSADGQSAIIYNSNDGNAYLVRSGFWGYYKTNNGPLTLGAALEDEKNGTWNGTQCIATLEQAQQAFEKGILQWTSKTGVILLSQGTAMQKVLALSNGSMCTPSKRPNPPLLVR